MNSILFLFSPMFKEFGVDVANEVVSRNPSLYISGLCTGGGAVVNYVRSNISKNKLFFEDLEVLEKKWFVDDSQKIDRQYLKYIDEKYGTGTVGEVITADRRIGVGLVRGGLTRPDGIADIIKKNSNSIDEYIVNLFKYLEELFDEKKIDMVFCYAVAGAPAVALAHICKQRNIPFKRFTLTRIDNRVILDKDYKGRLQQIVNKYKSEDEVNRDLIDEASSYLRAYRNKPLKPSYEEYNFKNVVKNKFFKTFSVTVIYSILLPIKFLLPQDLSIRLSYIGLKRKIFSTFVEFRKIFVSFVDWKKTLPNQEFFYYPLHVDPEASTMVMSPLHTDQLAVIETLAKSLPPGAVLVVKEHLPMLGKRPRGFYRKISFIPRVVLISPYYNSHELITKSEGVVVIAGTAALEALLLKKPLIVIGDSPFLAIESGVIHEPCLCNLPVAFKRLENLEKVDDSSLIRFIACTFELSFKMNSSALWRSYRKLGENEKKALIKNIVQFLKND